jgi:hypothetical protein
VVAFGKLQFGKMPRTFGGGRPQLAWLKFTSSEPKLGETLSLSASNGFYGPVAILLRSESEILFVSPNDLTNRSPQGMQIRAELVDSITFLNTTEAQRSANNKKQVTISTNSNVPTLKGADK